jgi:hypothetical protein
VNPQVRANFIGTAANVTTDATANTGNAQVGYIYTDYNSNNRATFTFQNTSQNSNLANWSWGDSTFSNGVSNVGNVVKTYTTTGAKTVALTANGTPNGVSSTAQSNTLSVTGYIFIANNPTAPTNLSGFSNLAIANTSEGTSHYWQQEQEMPLVETSWPTELLSHVLLPQRPLPQQPILSMPTQLLQEH